MIQLLSGLFSSTSFIWKLIKNWKVLSDSLKAIENTMHNMSKDGRFVPNMEETPILLHAVSNIIKTEIIDIPGINEYEIALSIDQISSNFVLSIQDAKSEKFYQLPVIKKEEVKP